MKVTNLQKVVEFVNEGQDKNTILDRIVNELGKSRSNAFVYYTKAMKLVGGDVKVKARPVKANSTDAFIQKVIQERKAGPQRDPKTGRFLKKSETTSPFAGLGV